MEDKELKQYKDSILEIIYWLGVPLTLSLVEPFNLTEYSTMFITTTEGLFYSWLCYFIVLAAVVRIVRVSINILHFIIGSLILLK